MQYVCDLSQPRLVSLVFQNKLIYNSKVTKWFFAYEKELFICLLVILTSFLSYGLGLVANFDKNQASVSITNETSNRVSKQALVQNILPETVADNLVVTSKKGTKYYYPWCGGIKNIKTENLQYFNSAQSAELAGYTLASNCKANP